MEKNGYFYYQLGIKSLQDEDVAQALNHFLFSIAIERHFKTYEKLYECCCMLDYKEEADTFIKLAYSENKKNDKVAFLYAKTLIDYGKLDEAETILLEILERNKDYMPALKEYERLQEYKTD